MGLTVRDAREVPSGDMRSRARRPTFAVRFDIRYHFWMREFRAGYKCPFDGRLCENAEIFGDGFDLQAQKRISKLCDRCARGNALEEGKRVWSHRFSGLKTQVLHRSPKNGL
jgi:hypothetical protein